MDDWKSETDTPQAAYKRGFRDALYAYSWMKDGVSYVGTCGKRLDEAYREVDAGTHFNFSPEQ